MKLIRYRIEFTTRNDARQYASSQLENSLYRGAAHEAAEEILTDWLWTEGKDAVFADGADAFFVRLDAELESRGFDLSN